MTNLVPMARTTGALTRRDPKRMDLFRRTKGKHLRADEIDLAIEMSEVYGANPLVNDIYFFVFNPDDEAKRYVVPVLSVGLYRKIAARAGDYRPDDRPSRFTYDEKLVGPDNPRGIVDCEVTVYKFSHDAWHPITQRVRWAERAPIVEDGADGFKWEPTGEKYPDGHPKAGKMKHRKVAVGEVVVKLDPTKKNWATMPETMLEKCFCEETEILTIHGFRRFADVGNSPIMQVTQTGLEPVVAKPFFQPYDGDMIAYIGDKALNFMVTPNHDMVVTTGKIEAGVMYEEARARARHFIPRIAPGRQLDAPVSDAAIRLCAAVLCDGWFSSSVTASISVSRDYKIERLRSYGLAKGETVLRTAGDTSTLKTGRVITTKRDKTVFAFDTAELGGLLIGAEKRPDLDLFSQLSMRQAKVFIDEMVFFDGNIDVKTGVRRFTQKPGGISDLFEMVACAAGYCVSVGKNGDAKVITISDRNAIPVSRWNRPYLHHNGEGKQRVGLQKVPNPGKGVWCVTVPSGQIVVRRGAFSMVCGNCTEVACIRKGWPNETAGSYGEGELDAVNVIDLTATEILEQEAQRTRLARVGALNTITIDWMDGKELEHVPAGKFHDRAMTFIRDHTQPGQEEFAVVLAWWDKNRNSIRSFWGIEKDAGLDLKQRIERIAEKANAEVVKP